MAAWVPLLCCAAAPRRSVLLYPNPADDVALGGRTGFCTSDDLLQWAAGRGAVVHGALAVAAATGWRRTGGELTQTADGLGLFSSRPIPAHETVLSVPAHLVLRADVPASVLPAATRRAESIAASVLLALRLLKEMQLGGRSAWRPYIDCLPAACHLPICGADADVEAAADPGLMARTAELRHAMEEAITGTDWSAAGVDRPSVGRWLWAVGMVMSRSVEAPAGSLALVPVWDMVNHRAPGTVRGRAAGSDGLSWAAFTTQATAAGAELRRDYFRVFGKLDRSGVPNSVLLQRLGFVSENAGNDFHRFDVQLPGEGGGARARLLREGAVRGSGTHPELLLERRLMPETLARFRAVAAAQLGREDMVVGTDLKRPAVAAVEWQALTLVLQAARSAVLWSARSAARGGGRLRQAAERHRRLLSETASAAAAGAMLRQGRGAEWLRRSCNQSVWADALAWPVHVAQRALLPRYSDSGFAVEALPAELQRRLAGLWAEKGAAARPEAEFDSGRDVEGKVVVADVTAARTGPLLRLLPLQHNDHALADDLVQYVRSRLEAWAGVRLRHTSLYGLREYRRGAVLVPHVDNYRTHILSAVVHVSSSALTAPWPMAVWTPGEAGCRLVDMGPGANLLLYESATVMHGRPEPLSADSFVNVFVHFEPQDWSVAGLRKQLSRLDLQT